MSAKMNAMSLICSTLAIATLIPGLLIMLYINNIILISTLKISLVIFFFIFFIGPLIFKFSYSLQRQVIFLNYVNLPKNPHYNSPEKYGLNGTRNYYISSSDNVKLGVWHMLPNSLVKETSFSDEEYEKALQNGQPIIIYMHGNSGNRAAAHRIELYKILRENYHVIAFDYRSYGDSTCVGPTERGVVKDAETVINYVKNRTQSKIFVWGHSLGTGISIHTLHLLALDNIFIDGLILESPFNSISQEVVEHPYAMLFKHLPWFQFTISDPLYNSGFRFQSIDHILHVTCPILILHAEDDMIVPYKLGYNLYKVALKHRSYNEKSIQFQSFSKKFGYGHKYICRAPELPQIIKKFVEQKY